MKQQLYILLFILSISFVEALGQTHQPIDSIEMYIEAAQSQSQKLEYLLKASDEQLFRKPEKSLVFAREALMLSYKLSNEKAAMEASCLLGRSYLNIDSLKQALKHSKIALSKSQNLNNQHSEARANRLLGKVFIELSDFNMAADYLFRSLGQFTNLEATDELSNTNLAIGYMYYLLLSFDKSLEYYQKALHYSMQTQNQTDIALALNNIASVYSTMNENEKAKRYYYKSLEINKKLNNKSLLAVNFQNLGIINMELKSLPEAYSFLQKSIYLYDSINNTKDLLPCLLNLSKYYSTIGQPDSMLYYVHKVLNASDSSMLPSINLAYSMLYKHYLANNIPDSSNKYGMLYYKTNNELNTDKHFADVQNLELKYGFQHEQQKMELAAREKLFNRILIIFALLILLMFLSWVTIRLQKRNKTTQQEKHTLDMALEVKNKELMTNVMVSLQKNDALQEVKGSIKEIKANAVKTETKHALDQITRKIHEVTNANVWNDFEMRFKHVHNDFYKKILKDFPDLTSNEKRMCAFLKLDMSTKEISSLTGQSIQALEKARIRLRKKLGISKSSVNLTTFISKY